MTFLLTLGTYHYSSQVLEMDNMDNYLEYYYTNATQDANEEEMIEYERSVVLLPIARVTNARLETSDV